MLKHEAIAKLRRQLEAIEPSYRERRHSTTFEKWYRNTEVAIEKIFGSKTRHLKDFHDVPFSLSVATTTTPDSAFEKAFHDGLRSAKALLESFIEEVDEYWETDGNAPAGGVRNVWPPAFSEPIATEAAELTTDIFSRNQFDRDVSLLIEKATEREPLTLAMADVDHFKQFNDEHGHLVGDRVLSAVASTLKSVVGGRGRVYRYGGEEFAILLPNHTNDEAAPLLERVRQAVEGIALEGLEAGVTLSLGASACEDKAMAPKDLIEQADEALYASKNDGRNRVTLASSGTTPGKRSATRQPIEIGLKCLRSPNSRGERHDYSLQIRLINTTERPIPNYHVDVEVPRGILEDIGQFPTRVRERDSQTHILLRVTEAAHRNSPLYPGDPTMVFTFPYIMDDKRFCDKALLQEKLQVTVFAEGRKIHIERRVEDIIDF